MIEDKDISALLLPCSLLTNYSESRSLEIQKADLGIKTSGCPQKDLQTSIASLFEKEKVHR